VEALRRPPKLAPGAEETKAQDRASRKAERLLSSTVIRIGQLHVLPLDARQNGRLSGIVTAHLKRFDFARTVALRTQR
jgi:hypothetical protein